jgi:4-hydroxy-4-methyl-2-oxoglutarate aldolase
MTATGPKAFPTGTICDAARELSDHVRIKSQIPRGQWRIDAAEPVIGPAYTIKVSRARTPSESPLEDFFTAVDNVPEGSFVVCQVVGHVEGATIGDAITTRFAKQGAVGMVVDGDVRDYTGVIAAGIPTWVRGAQVEGMLVPRMKVEAQVDIQLGGVDLSPGDYVSGDADGLFVIPAGEVDAVLAAAAAMDESEQHMFALLQEGATIASVYHKTGRA